MNSFELNKILGAILGTCLITLALNIGAGAIFAPEKPAKPGYNIAVQEHGGGGAAGPAKEAEEPMEVMMAILSRRAARTGLALTSMASSAARAPRKRASTIRPP